MNRLEKVLRTCILVFALGIVSCTIRGPETRDAYFDYIDANDNEKIDVNEFSEAVSSRAFSEMDTDSNGALDAKEWEQTETDETAAKRFSETDVDKDGVLSYEEFTSLERKKVTMQNLFSTLDRDGDGVLKREEFDQHFSN